MHADMDAFYAAVEQLDRPELRGLPVIVGFPGGRSVVTTASYEARPFGVHSAMPMAQAVRLCPQAVVVPPRFERYEEASATIMGAFARFSPSVEPLSLDEAFLDMSGSEGLFGSPEVMGRKVKRAVYEATRGLTVSVGVAATKYVAKVASDVHKPDGLTVVPLEETEAFLDPLPVRRLWGVGPRGADVLARLHLHTIADVRCASRSWLISELGSLGGHIFALAHGDDPRAVESERQAQSVGHEETLARDVRGPAATHALLLGAADEVAQRLRADGLLARGVRVKLKTASFRLMTRQCRLAAATDSAKPLYEAALALLPEFDWDEPLRLVGLAATQLADDAAPLQRELFEAEHTKRLSRLDRALDAVRGKFGDTAVRRATAVERHGEGQAGRGNGGEARDDDGRGEDASAGGGTGESKAGR